MWSPSPSWLLFVIMCTLYNKYSRLNEKDSSLVWGDAQVLSHARRASFFFFSFKYRHINKFVFKDQLLLLDPIRWWPFETNVLHHTFLLLFVLAKILSVDHDVAKFKACNFLQYVFAFSMVHQLSPINNLASNSLSIFNCRYYCKTPAQKKWTHSQIWSRDFRSFRKGVWRHV